MARIPDAELARLTVEVRCSGWSRAAAWCCPRQGSGLATHFRDLNWSEDTGAINPRPNSGGAANSAAGDTAILLLSADSSRVQGETVFTT